MNTFLLAVLAVCAVVLTFLSLLNFVQFQRTLHEARRMLGSFQNLLGPAQRAAGRLEEAVHRTCDTALGFVETASFLGKRWGMRAGPRTRRHGSR